MGIKIRPVAGKLLLRVKEEQEQVTAGGIIIQKQTARNGSREAFVEALPNGYSGDLVVGDLVMLPPYAGAELRLNGTLYVFAKPEALEAALE